MNRLVITMGVSTAEGVPIELPPALLERIRKANQLQVLTGKTLCTINAKSYTSTL
jgi:hypothetical protein